MNTNTKTNKLRLIGASVVLAFLMLFAGWGLFPRVPMKAIAAADLGAEHILDVKLAERYDGRMSVDFTISFTPNLLDVTVSVSIDGTSEDICTELSSLTCLIPVTVQAKMVRGQTYAFRYSMITDGSVSPRILIANKIVSLTYPLVSPFPETPIKDGHTFIGWYLDAACTQPYDGRPITEDTDLYAGWTINQYTVNYNVNGGTAISSKTADYGTSYTLPTPVRTGYNFDGWYRNVGLTDKITTSTYVIPANETTLYAKWVSAAVTVTYNVNGGTAITAYSGLPGAVYTLPTPVKSGFTFDGWYTTAAFTAGTKCTSSYTVPSASVTLYAKWIENVSTPTVTYNVNGGTAITAYSAAPGTVYTLPVPVRTGYTFTGWYIESDFSGTKLTASYTVPAINITLYAKWEVFVTITFEVNGGNAIAPYVTSAINTNYTLPVPTRYGYVFGGWFSNAGLTTSVGNSISIQSDVTLYAKWTAVASGVTVTYNVNGGTAISAYMGTAGASYTLPDPIRSGYTFDGWYTSNAFTAGTKVTSPYTIPSTDITLYAKWAAVVSGVTITFNVNGGTSVSAYTGTPGASYTLPTPVKSGNTFEGWYTTSALTAGTKVLSPYTIPSASLTLYAKWTVTPTSIVITYNVNGGTAITSYSGTTGAVYTLPTPTKPGYTFDGWYTNILLTSGSKVASAYTLPSSDVTLYAKWTANKYTVTFYVGGAVYETLQVEYGAILGLVILTEPKLNGYAFFQDEEMTEPVTELKVESALSVYGREKEGFFDGFSTTAKVLSSIMMVLLAAGIGYGIYAVYNKFKGKRR